MRNDRTTRRAPRLARAVLGAILLASGSAYATTYYVANSGSDSNDGQSLGTSFLTLQHAADVAQPGDTIEVLQGTYLGFRITPKNNPNNAWITMEPYDHQAVTIVQGHQNDASGGFAVSASDPNCALNDASTAPDPCQPQPVYFIVQGFNITGIPDANWLMDIVHLDAPYVQLLNNSIHDTPYGLIKISRGSGNVSIVGNDLYHGGTGNDNGFAFDIVGANNVYIAHNYVHDFGDGGGGGFVKGNAHHALVESNVFAHFPGVNARGFMLGALTGVNYLKNGNYESYDSVVRNNIFVDTGGACTGAVSSYDAQIYNNVCYDVGRASPRAIYIGDESDTNPADGGGAQWDQPNTDVVVENNIVVASHEVGYAVHLGPNAMTDPSTLDLDHNVYSRVDANGNISSDPVYFAFEQIPGLYGLSFQLWQQQTAAAGYPEDQHSVFADPQFNNVASLNFPPNTDPMPQIDASVGASSPAIGIGGSPCAPTDFYNNPRPAGGACDAGVYQAQ